MEDFWSKNKLERFAGAAFVVGVSGFALYYVFNKINSTQNSKLSSHIQLRRGEQAPKVELNRHEKILLNDLISPEQISVTFDSIGGLEKVKQSLYETVIAPFLHPELFQGNLVKPPKGILLYGPPGTGKTMLVKAIAKETKCMFLNVQISSLMNKWLGESERLVTAIFTLAEKIQPCIIFIDEIDSLFSKRSETDHEVTVRMKSCFMSLWDGILNDKSSQITIIGCTNRPSAMDEALLRRMPHTFHVGLPNTEQREKILRVILKEEKLDDDVDFKRLAGELDGYSGSDIQALCEEAARAPVHEILSKYKNKTQQLGGNLTTRNVCYQDFIEAKKVVHKTGTKFEYTFSSRSRSRSFSSDTNQEESKKNSQPPTPSQIPTQPPYPNPYGTPYPPVYPQPYFPNPYAAELYSQYQMMQPNPYGPPYPQVYPYQPIPQPQPQFPSSTQPQQNPQPPNVPKPPDPESDIYKAD